MESKISSWQMEVSKDKQCYSFSGGMGDCEFAGWWKKLQGLSQLCKNLTDTHHKYIDLQPQEELQLPERIEGIVPEAKREGGKLGIWFEFEVTTRDTRSMKKTMMIFA